MRLSLGLQKPIRKVRAVVIRKVTPETPRRGPGYISKPIPSAFLGCNPCGDSGVRGECAPREAPHGGRVSPGSPHSDTRHQHTCRTAARECRRTPRPAAQSVVFLSLSRSPAAPHLGTADRHSGKGEVEECSQRPGRAGSAPQEGPTLPRAHL